MILENDVCKVEISNVGAEIHHFINKKTNTEWMWDGDKAFWDQHNPILFPIVGSTFDKKIHLGQETYEMGNHGFARRALFTTQNSDLNSCELLLESNMETLAQYPFEFKLKVRYDLDGTCLNITYTVENHSNKDMPFSIGFHPAFMTSHNGKDGSQVVRFSNQEKDLPQAIFNQEKNSLAFTDEFFKGTPTLLLENIVSPYVVLEDGNDTMKVNVVGYRWLAFWKKPEAKFLCIEPWHGHSDFEEVNCDFSEREGTLILKPKRIYTTTQTYVAGVKENNNV